LKRLTIKNNLIITSTDINQTQCFQALHSTFISIIKFIKIYEVFPKHIVHIIRTEHYGFTLLSSVLLMLYCSYASMNVIILVKNSLWQMKSCETVAQLSEVPNFIIIIIYSHTWQNCNRDKYIKYELRLKVFLRKSYKNEKLRATNNIQNFLGKS